MKLSWNLRSCDAFVQSHCSQTAKETPAGKVKAAIVVVPSKKNQIHHNDAHTHTHRQGENNTSHTTSKYITFEHLLQKTLSNSTLKDSPHTHIIFIITLLSALDLNFRKAIIQTEISNTKQRKKQIMKWLSFGKISSDKANTHCKALYFLHLKIDKNSTNKTILLNQNWC